MTAPLPNPFEFENSAASPNFAPAAEQATASCVPSENAVAVPFTPTKAFLDKLYAEIVGAEDPELPPLFLRKPSPAFMRALFELGR